MPRLWIQALCIVAVILGIYQYAPHATFMPIDDGLLVYANPIVTNGDVHGVFASFDPELYIPLTFLSYQAEYALFGEDPTVYHVDNVLLHIANAILVLLLLRFFSKKWIVPFIGAMLFAVHPIQVEAVMWVSGRKDLLCAFFYLASLVGYCRYRVSGTRGWFYGSVALFVLALLSKVLAISLPIALMIIDDMLPAKKEQQYERLSKWAFYIPALAFLFIGVCGKLLSIQVLGIDRSILLALKGVYFYLEKLLLPIHLSLLYPQTSPIVWYHPDFLFAGAILTMLGILTITSRQFGKVFSFGMLWFGITVLPNLGNAAKGASTLLFYASDRYVYLASIGIFFLIAIGINWLLEHTHRYRHIAVLTCTVFIVAAYAYSAHRYAMQWLTPRPYVARMNTLYPENPFGHALAGVAALREEDLNVAITELRIAGKQTEQYKDAKASLGLALLKNDETERGMTTLQEVLHAVPQHVFAHIYLAYGYLLEHNTTRAEQLLIQALGWEPDNATALQLLGTIRLQQHRLTEAENLLRESLQHDPRSIRTKATLATLLRERNSSPSRK